MSQAGRRLAAIMYTDIEGYTALTQGDESLAMKLLEAHRELIRPRLASIETPFFLSGPQT